MIISLNFNKKEESIFNDLKEIAGDKVISKFIKDVLVEFLEKYQINPALKERDAFNKNIELVIQKLNDSDYWTRAIQHLDDKNLRILESAVSSIQIKTSKKMNYGTVNVR